MSQDRAGAAYLKTARARPTSKRRRCGLPHEGGLPFEQAGFADFHKNGLECLIMFRWWLLVPHWFLKMGSRDSTADGHVNGSLGRWVGRFHDRSIVTGGMWECSFSGGHAHGRCKSADCPAMFGCRVQFRCKCVVTRPRLLVLSLRHDRKCIRVLLFQV